MGTTSLESLRLQKRMKSSFFVGSTPLALQLLRLTFLKTVWSQFGMH